MLLVWETGPSNKPVSTEANDMRTKDRNDGKPGGKVGTQPFALIVRQKSDLVTATRSGANRGGVRSKRQRRDNMPERREAIGQWDLSCFYLKDLIKISKNNCFLTG